MRPSAGLAALVLLALACDVEPAGETNAAADALLRELQADDYTAWDATEVPTPSFHGARVRVFTDDVLVAARDGAAIERWPTDAIAIAEVRDAEDDAIAALLVAQRGRDAWLWAAYDRDLNATSYGTAVACVHCHAAGDDFLRSISLPE